ncbi:MAG TPA: aminoglycoside phosphotransferase family protein [Pirellulales bacterium]|nr:aminoglycoside phosphotransferase family protein [Pirellulales bacterium]
MTIEHALRRVLAAYPPDCQPHEADDLASAGGFSGARLWRLHAPRGMLCLRRWPAEQSPSQLEFIQAVLWHVVQEGFSLAPLPLETRTLAGYVEEAGRLWEVTPWMPGKADYRQAPSPARLRAAMHALAAFHLAAASFPHAEHSPAVPPGIVHRRARLRAWSAEKRARLGAAIPRGGSPELAERAGALLPLFDRALSRVAETLASAERLTAPLQPCIRDIWHDHVLYLGQRVSGLIDFGALRVDSVAADVARLCGSLCGDDSEAWLAALQAYDELRRLSEEEALLVTAYDRANVLLSGMNWLDWIYLRGRVFERHEAVCQRLDENLQRLTRLADACGSP